MRAAACSAGIALALGVSGLLRAQAPEPRLMPVEWKPPVYTEAAWRARIAGRVELELTVDPAGRVAQIVVTKNLPMGLDLAAIWAAMRWTFPTSDAIARRTHVSVDFELDPADASEDGGLWADDGRLRAWRVNPWSVLMRGLTEGRALALESEEALAAVEAVTRDRATGPNGRPQRVSLGGTRPDRRFMRRFDDLHHRVWRVPIADRLGAEPMNVARVSVSPRGPILVELVTEDRHETFHDVYSVERREGSSRVVEASLAFRPYHCCWDRSPEPLNVATGIYLHPRSTADAALVATGATRRRPQIW